MEATAVVLHEAANGHQTPRTLHSESSVDCESFLGPAAQQPPEDELVLENGISRLPKTLPVDMQFENISFTASLGFRKGMRLFLNYLEDFRFLLLSPETLQFNKIVFFNAFASINQAHAYDNDKAR